MKRLAQVLAGAEQGGAESFFVRLVSALQGQPGLEQQAFLRPYEQRVRALRSAGVASCGFRFPGPLRPWERVRYRQALRRYRPDIVLTWMNRASALTPPGDYTLVSRLGHYYNLKYYRHADYWIGITKGICDHLVRGGMPVGRVVQIPNFADEHPVEPVTRADFATPPDCPLLLAAGRLHVNKGFDVLLTALQQVPEAMLWLAGSGPEEAALKTLCRELGLEERVRFLGWRDDVTALMRSADLFVCPSRHEGLGSIVLEAWAHHCPIIATASQGPAELIEHGETGLVTPVDETVALAGAIASLLRQPAMRARLADNGWRHYQQRFSRAVVVRQYQDFFASLPGLRPHA
ncbi:Glycosyl transferase, group 1 [Alloalcanivorax dieselolei B5]|uniref:Glycosyl transferase, group 1 n=1 Tax=Alcanivorax dieselolei (strain DSM 16502 / CGMCC 1.3690 / MCCC 1A00001 / B-5) TaxID=930169 RepID=K0CK37_ALCDB|nr:glycosyltransferase [Alloalcanivorax dieselolei]AFT71921.1 Glycosyl transferase, group 1 [Alloalcanivorax dieselolei B5]GGK08719.1 glycosyl transferase [Alloalcanivorax dieselolei]